MTDILQKFREEARLTDEEIRKVDVVFQRHPNEDESIGDWALRIMLLIGEATAKAQLNKTLSLRLNDDYKPDPKGRYVLGIVDLKGELPEFNAKVVEILGGGE